MVFYRKYRPQKISELDSREVREKLFPIFSKDSPHAFLFTGSKGLGKTSTARIIAKVVNCQRLASSKLASSSKDKKLNARRYTLDAEVEPCNECAQCRSITNGTNLDVLEIDGASNRGIDEIRDLREKIRLSPLSSTKKVYIIDEVHMLTTEAFNALLKTLEEPPSHALFILCTTESHKVPETILSRCFHITFKKATDEELVNSLTRIAKGEKLKIEPEVLAQIAKLADGGFRDGAKILEEIAFLSKGELITKEFIDNKYQISNTRYQVSKMTIFLLENDTRSALQLVSELTKQGVDMKYFIEQMINILHDELLVRVGVSNNRSLITNHQFTIRDIQKLVELLTRAHGELKYAVLPQLPLELVIIEWGSNALRSSFQFEESSDGAPAVASGDLGVRSPSATLVKIASHEKTPRAEPDIWSRLIEKVKKHNHSIAGVLRGCLLKTYSSKELIIEAKYKFHKDRLMEPKTLEILEKALEGLTGDKVKIMIELKSQ